MRPLLLIANGSRYRKTKAPSRVCFCQFGPKREHPHNDNHTKMIVVNACLLCLAAEESVDHLLLNCRLANTIWNSFLRSFDCSCVLDSISGLLFSWWLSIGLSKGRIMWCLSFFGVISTIWKERYHRYFEGKSSIIEDILARLCFSVAYWVSILR